MAKLSKITKGKAIAERKVILTPKKKVALDALDEIQKIFKNSGVPPSQIFKRA